MHLATNYKILVMKTKAWIMNILHHKPTQKLITTLVLMLLLMIILPNLTHTTPEKGFLIKLSLTDNPLEKNKPVNTPSTPTGYHPLKSSPASTNISNKP
uniref:Female-specific orf protein n=1 Tax=Truncilla macrodon TaxID=1009867 RepID=F4ZFQ4_9BIVA|nr:female-specific orf protein [Truncilla macrodon]